MIQPPGGHSYWVEGRSPKLELYGSKCEWFEKRYRSLKLNIEILNMMAWKRYFFLTRIAVLGYVCLVSLVSMLNSNCQLELQLCPGKLRSQCWGELSSGIPMGNGEIFGGHGKVLHPWKLKKAPLETEYISTKTMNFWVPAASFRGVYVLRNRCISVIICFLPTWGSWMPTKRVGHTMKISLIWKGKMFEIERKPWAQDSFGTFFFATCSALGCHDKRKPWAGKTQTSLRAMVSNFYPYLGRRSNLTCAYFLSLVTQPPTGIMSWCPAKKGETLFF